MSINKIPDDGPKLKVSGVEIKHPVFVDDMAGIGHAEVIESMEPKMKHLEKTKKYIFNNEKGKSEIMKIEPRKLTKRSENKNPIVTVKKGVIGNTERYKYMGDMYDKTGTNLPKIEKKMEKSSFIASEVCRMGNYAEVGAADTSVRELLMETVVKPSLLFNTETWINITKEELRRIDKQHYMILKRIFEQKEHVPYYGILAETGYWPFSYVIVYKRLMFFHHLIHSEERRIARRITINQMNAERPSGTNWYAGVKEWLEKLELTSDEERIKEIEKSKWKKEVKEKIGKVVSEEIGKKTMEMKKLRFIRNNEKKEYIKANRMAKVKSMMKVRLNMVEIKANFKGKYKDLKCAACKKEEETTEHVIKCSEYKRLIGHSIEVENTVEESMQETEWLKEASEVFERIEETRQWLM